MGLDHIAGPPEQQPRIGDLEVDARLSQRTQAPASASAGNRRAPAGTSPVSAGTIVCAMTFEKKSPHTSRLYSGANTNGTSSSCRFMSSVLKNAFEGARQ